MRRRELAAHLQRAEAAIVGSYLEAGARLGRSRGTGTRRIGGAICLGTPSVDHPFLSRALGVGTIADATPGLLERIERHYATLGRPARVSIANGIVPPATLRLLERRGYRPAADVDVFVYAHRGRPPRMPAVPGLTIERAGPDLAALYARTAYESFRERGPEFRAVIEALVRSRRRTLRAFLGRIDGTPAATGMLYDVGPVGGLANGSVRPAFRGRGIQRAMIVHRMRDGWARGRRLFFTETANPASARNMEALGWRRLYDEVEWERPTPPGAAGV